MNFARAASIFAVALLLVAASPPEEVEAADCTKNYLLCLNSATQLGSPFEEMASVECGVAWFACVSRQLREA